MSERLQSGLHPDADQLSAFQEDALPLHERELTLAHLAVCPECRAIVAESLPSLPELEPVRVEAARRPWFAGWKLAWPALALVAAIAVFMISIHRVPITPAGPGASTQIAGSHPPAPLPTPDSPHASTLKAPDARDSGPPPGNGDSSTGEHTRTVAQLPVQGRNAASLADLSQATRSSGAESLRPPVKASAGVGGMSAGTGIGSGNGAGGGARPVVSVDSMVVAAAPVVLPAPPAPSSVAAANASKTVGVASTPPTIETVSGDMSSFSIQPGGFQDVGFQHLLPSRLPVLSSIEHERRIIAIDTRNAVFMSKDAGMHWKAVKAPWLGRAVHISLAVSGSGYVAKAGVSPSQVGGAVLSLNRLPATPGCRLTGAVTDLTGAAIPGASVSVMNTETHAIRFVQTDREGRYSVDGLAPGSYDVEARARGFNPRLLAAVTVAEARQNVTDLLLSVGAETQTVTVEAETEPLGNSRAARKAAVAAPASSKPRPLFEITTDSGEHWVSTDGMGWKLE